MRLTLKVWRQESTDAEGRLVEYAVDDVSPDMSFLEMLDVLNERLTLEGETPIVFEHDCREGICGACGMMIDGVAHGPNPGTTTCQLHMRSFSDGDTIVIEPWRSAAFAVMQDLMVDRNAFDRIVESGGYISVNTGSAPDANEIPVPKANAERSFEAATCIGCGACVAQCPNGAAHLFTSAKVSHLGLLPQGQPERFQRVDAMVAQMEEEAFGSCSNHRECEAVCPKGISVDFIARMNRDHIRSSFKGRKIQDYR
ncbi:MAG: succinate dehydrogenase/fumarate reductase iron-sulfur subunit [Acidobacteriota bacterium]